MERRLALSIGGFCDVPTSDRRHGYSNSGLAVIADLDVLSVAQWGSWVLLLIFSCQWSPFGCVAVVPLDRLRSSLWDFSDGIGSVDDCTDRGPKSHGCIFWHLGCSFRCCAWFCDALLSLGWLAFVANAHKVATDLSESASHVASIRFVIGVVDHGEQGSPWSLESCCMGGVG